MCSQNMKHNKIGIFDSGLGGLSVYQAIKNWLPNESIIYLGDTARAPYGGRPKEQLMSFALQIIDFLVSQQVKAVVFGCNTISANCYAELVQRYELPMFELIQSAIEESLQTSRRAIGYLATEASVKSGAFSKGVKALSNLPVYAVGCPQFVPLVEEGLTDPAHARPAVELYLTEILPHIDSLVLGCTHYPFLFNAIQQVIGDRQIHVINPAHSAAAKVAAFLTENQLLATEKGQDQFYTTGVPAKFEALTQRLIGIDISASPLKLAPG